MNVHNMAQVGFGTGTNEHYDRARPSYQAPVLAYIREQLPASSTLNVLEIGSGTGLFTRALLAHPAWASSIAALRAVEPSEGMRAQFNKATSDPRISCTDGTFSSTGVADGWADVIFIAQAFHWCHPDYDPASAEFARALKPGGIVCLVWNLEDRDGAQWVAQLRDLYEPYEQGAPQFRLCLWRATFETPSYVKSFDKPVEKTWTYPLIGTKDIVVDRVFSKSYMTVLSPEGKEKAKTEVLEILQRGDGLVYTDKDAGVFEYPYKTLVRCLA